jgi:hypothetical protein
MCPLGCGSDQHPAEPHVLPDSGREVCGRPEGYPVRLEARPPWWAEKADVDRMPEGVLVPWCDPCWDAMATQAAASLAAAAPAEPVAAQLDLF